MRDMVDYLNLKNTLRVGEYILDANSNDKSSDRNLSPDHHSEESIKSES